MHAPQAMLVLVVLPRTIIPTTALGHSIGANCPLNAAVPGITITIISGTIPLRIATLTEAAPIVTGIIVTDTSPILLGRGAGRRIMKQPTVFFLMTTARLSEGIPPVEGMNMRV